MNALASGTGILLALAAATTASARGCSEPLSARAAYCSTWRSENFPLGWMSVTSGCPFVRVPVLSKMSVVTLWARSSASPPLMRMPRSAPFPVPTMMAVGVANPSAHGQAMMRTATKLVRPKMNAGSGPKANQTAKVTPAITITAGTKRLDT